MCGRYVLLSELQEILERYDIEEETESNFNTGEVFPTNVIPVIINENKNQLKQFKWGFSFKGRKGSIINARAETITDKPMFKNSFYHRRCIIPANGFYEWKSEGSKKIKHLIEIENERIFSMAGIYNISVDEKNNPIWSFAIITTEANDKMSEIHNRMPVILAPNDERTWLDTNIRDITLLKSLLNPFDNQKTLIKLA